ncbi:MAG: hypothetical protein QXT50_02465, partial [Thermofilum sp.]
VSDRLNRLIGRREVRIAVEHPGTGTPSRKEIAERVKALLNLTERHVIIVKKILTEYGLGRSNVLVHIYDEVERAKRFEPVHLLKKHGLTEAASSGSTQG